MSTDNKGWLISLAMGLAFAIMGILELMAMFAEGEWIVYVAANGNVMMGLALLLVSAIFLAAVKAFRSGTDGRANLIVGSMIGLFVGLVALLTLLADATEAYLLANEDFAGWTLLDDFTPAILMMIPCLAVLWQELKAFGAVKPRQSSLEGKE